MSSTAPAEFIVDAVLFDMDGTLVNSIAAVEAAWGAVADEIGQPRKSVIEATHGRRASDNLKDWKPQIKDEQLDGEVEKFEQSILNHADQYKKRRDSRSSSQSSSRRASSSASSRRPSQAQLFGSFTPIDKTRKDSTSQGKEGRVSSGQLAKQLEPLSLDKNNSAVDDEAVEDEEDEDLGPDMGVRILPGVRALIDSLPKGRYAVATSGARVYAYGAMERAGIVAPEVTITAEDPRLKNGKPHPDPFLLAAECLGYDCNKCLVVEDSPSGIKAGVASGAITLAVCTSHEEHQIKDAGAQHLVHNLEAVRAEQLADGRLKFTIDPSRIVTDSKSDARTDVGLKEEDKESNIKRRFSQTNTKPVLSHPPHASSEPVHANPVSIPFNALLSPITTVSLLACIKAAFGPDPSCLGIIIITDLPAEFDGLRKELLELSNKFARMAEEKKERYADEESSFSFGWSRAKEYMNGMPDTLKGSYYGNPLLDRPQVDPTIQRRHPEYYKGNIWPNEDEDAEVNGFQQSFKKLGSFVVEVGLLLTRACESFVSPQLQIQTNKTDILEGMLARSSAHKARLLHYYPPPPSGDGDENDDDQDSWCGWHLDHSLITGLVSAMYMFEEGDKHTPIANPHERSGLYIRNRANNVVKVTIPENALAFQTGEALELLTGGKLHATPHCVRGGGPGQVRLGDAVGDVSRETFAVFMQPDVWEQIGTPEETFGTFTKEVLRRHYRNKKQEEGVDVAYKFDSSDHLPPISELTTSNITINLDCQDPALSYKHI
ncbi:hypothetical protein E3P81_01036 [Wallemia ichthyophaga]|uniref:2-deoxyglucose-6-phosphate phosphatase 2 n=1 Tax=Wallemia ichthyophaga TaxID=245174 RepID=A0A4T0KGB3_WALIC|nr:hypothetical protein E3P97_01037 [Wallemia ichthyophaga]TIB30842.1 hypothetical protein E3P85_02526 [Wallemia ichthyophaga]TIB39784.1 hypothetical protein E3P86_00977 [Wallemia ichthyophaga]TIB49031.1 hypothetical protein E3P82_01035 [Wallemia ichthyophaga]TIB53029.1 hypothetical protein E3P81_01036 [Wallemia ichthyophaga]